MNSRYSVDRTKWDQLDIFNQMGNIYSEVGRSFKSSGAYRKQAINRAIDLFNATAESLAKDKSPRLREVLRAKEEYLRFITGTNLKESEKKSLENYFLHFATAARLRQINGHQTFNRDCPS